MSTLWLVATPIGNLADLSPRAVDVLAHVGLICCEDTRRTGLLLQHAGIKAGRLAVCNDHTEFSRVADVLGVLVGGARRRDRQRCGHAGDLRPRRTHRAGGDRRRLRRERGPRPERGGHGTHDQRARHRPVRVRGVPAPQGQRARRTPGRRRGGTAHDDHLRGPPSRAAHPRRPPRWRAATTGSSWSLANSRSSTRRSSAARWAPSTSAARAASTSSSSRVHRSTIAPPATTTSARRSAASSLPGSSTRDAAATVAKHVGRPKREVYALAVGLDDETSDDRTRDDKTRDDEMGGAANE